jgi:hypothetical protein
MLTMKVRKQGRGFRLWIPLFLVWLLLLPIVVVLLPLMLLVCLFMENGFRALAAGWQLLTGLRGTNVEFTEGAHCVALRIW